MGFEPTRPPFGQPTSQGHHTFPYLLITLTPVSEHLPTNTFQVKPYTQTNQGVPISVCMLRETILCIRGIPRINPQFHEIIQLGCYRWIIWSGDTNTLSTSRLPQMRTSSHMGLEPMTTWLKVKRSTDWANVTEIRRGNWTPFSTLTDNPHRQSFVHRAGSRAPDIN